MSSLVITNGRVIDPASGIDSSGDIVITDGHISALGSGAADGVEADRTIVASGLVVAPGFIDLHVHLREPGQEHKETIATGARAAAAGGFTTICAMPNTQPAIDNAALVEASLKEAAASSVVRVLATGCITKDRAGVELAPMAELVAAGAVALTDDGDFVADAGVMRRAFQYASRWNLPLAQHCEDPSLVAGGQMHEGWVSARLGLPGRPSSAEVAAVARDIALAEELGAHLHIQHLSTARAVQLVAEARARDVHVTAEVTPHHLTLTQDAIAFGLDDNGGGGGGGEHGDLLYDTNAKVNPPLREAADVAACVEGLRTGVIDCIATDHAPHARHEKQTEFDQAPPGLIGLETAFGLSMRLVHEGRLDLATLIERFTAGPVRAWGLDARTGIAGLGTLKIGAPGDVAILDPGAEWIVDAATIASRSSNTPLLGETLRGRVLTTVAAGQVVYDVATIPV